MATNNHESLPSHYGDWPNTQGFDVRYQELVPTELEVVGEIPAYAAGVLFRNGLGPRKVELSDDGSTAYKVSHWFDSFAQVHRFQIHAPTPDRPAVRVTHSSRLTSDGVIERVRRSGYMADMTFGAKRDPCLSLFQKIQSVFTPMLRSMPSRAPNEVNISVSLSHNFPGLSRTGLRQESGGGAYSGEKTKQPVATLCNKTDSATMQMLDPETLEPIGVVWQRSLHPSLAGPMSAAHACTDPVTGDVYNYNLSLGPDIWRVFSVCAATGRTSVLAEIRHTGAYVHSLFLTQNYVVLCVWNSFLYAGGAPTLWKRNIIDALADYSPDRPATWFVVDRRPGGMGLVATYESEPFYSFHSINAYEDHESGKEDDVDIVADLYAYDSLDILKRFYIENLLSDSPAAKAYFGSEEKLAAGAAPHDPETGEFRRFRLAKVPPLQPSQEEQLSEPRGIPPTVGKATVEQRGTPGLGPELPSINEALRSRRHRYVYGVTFTGRSTFLDGLVKYDVDTGAAVQWSEHGQTASEPIFVADPARAGVGADAEDAGVLLSVVLDGARGKSYLLVLDAKTMVEVARANVDGPVGFGFHGLHVPE